jgi:hypothetical protein
LARAERVGGGQGPEAIELSVEGPMEAEWIEAVIERLEIPAGRGREDAGGAQGSLTPPVLETKLSLPVRPFPAPTCWEAPACTVRVAKMRIATGARPQ